jgi:hypothetical protein
VSRSLVRTLIPLAALLGAASLVQSAVAGSATSVSGSSVTGVKVVRDTAGTSIGSTTFEDLPEASTTVKIPAGTRALILARFSAESLCLGPSGSPEVCSVRILIGGQEAEPASGSDFAFDSSNGGADGPYSWEGHSMDRSSGPLGPGTYIVKVQAKVTLVGGAFGLDDWSLTVERVRV